MVDLRPLRLAVKARLDTITGLNVLDDASGKIPLDPDGKAHQYAVLYPGGGYNPLAGEAVCGAPGEFVWRFQVTCAGGDIDRAEWALTRVRAAILGTQLTAVSGLIREDFTPEFAIQDTTATPLRWYYPAIFTVTLP
ncbi:hypothetical protein [Occultella kanbiaonis]|uniref:hypothetical protein n=1 Tax=Occultella kanbiaonis TaxID=2675754 RepID=UPI0013CFE65E|nr:hypothetical protein [Occultella kanbiaonis]